MAEQLTTNEKAAARMRRRRATIEGQAINLGRSRAFRELKKAHPEEFEQLFRAETIRAEAELRAKASRG